MLNKILKYPCDFSKQKILSSNCEKKNKNKKCKILFKNYNDCVKRQKQLREIKDLCNSYLSRN